MMMTDNDFGLDRACGDGGGSGDQLVEEEEAAALVRDESVHPATAADAAVAETAADHRRVRHQGGTAGRRPHRHAGQTAEQLSSLRSQTAGRCHQKHQMHHIAGPGDGTGSPRTTSGPGRSIALRTASSGHRRHPHSC